MTEHRVREAAESYSGTTLRAVDWTRDTGTIRRLFQDYREWLADHQDIDPLAKSRVNSGLGQIDQLIAELPRAYSPPRGDVILAFAKGEVVACGALRGVGPKVGEIKRVYVRADHRGPGFGPRLTQALLDRAAELGFDRVRVDTLPTMIAAIRFYQDMGFVPIPRYWPHPVAGSLFFEYTMPKKMPRRPGSPRTSRLRK